MTSDLLTREFRPEVLSRRGEAWAWLTAFLALTAWLMLRFTGQGSAGIALTLAIVLVLAAASISLGNWMDRHTLLHLDSHGVSFHNGLRQVQLTWDEIQQVQVFPSNWGNKVRVLGNRTQFAFRTLGEVKVGGQVKGRMGFVEGELILKRILEKAGLALREQTPNGRYYARL